MVSNVMLPDGLGVSRISIGEDAVWALASTGESGSDVLVRIDPATDRAVATTSLAPGPWYVAAGAGAVWVGFPNSSMIQRVDAATNEVTGQIRLPGDGVTSIAADDQAVWVEVIHDRSDQGFRTSPRWYGSTRRRARSWRRSRWRACPGTTMRSPSEQESCGSRA
jgi:hypothetical protein